MKRNEKQPFFGRCRDKIRRMVEVTLGEIFAVPEVDPTILPRERLERHEGRLKDILGRHGEEIIQTYLKKKGYQVLEKNIVLPSCEIDLVAHKKGTLVFVEIKTRREGEFTDLATEVSEDRRIRMIRAADEYRRWKNAPDAPVRFDLILLFYFQNGKTKLEHQENAFDQTSFLEG